MNSAFLGLIRPRLAGAGSSNDASRLPGGLPTCPETPPDRLPRSALFSQFAGGRPSHRVALHVAHSDGLGIGVALNTLIIYSRDLRLQRDLVTIAAEIHTVVFFAYFEIVLPGCCSVALRSSARVPARISARA